MKIDFAGLQKYAPVLLRIALSLVFLWFGINQLIHADMFLGYVPSWMFGPSGVVPISPNIIISINGVFEILFGLMLITGIFTRFVAFFLGLHMIGIMTGLGYNEVAVRDFGLMLATFSIVLHGPDDWCLENKFWKKV